jgi:hypothetical protein
MATQKKKKYRDFAITVNDEPLLLEDIDGDVMEWVNRWIPLAYANMFTVPNSSVSPRHEFNPIGGPVHIGLTLPNWGPLPPPQLNTLIWPTGASRWAYGVFLIEGERLKKIIDDGDTATGVRFRIESQGELVIDAKMWMLPAQPLSNAAGQPEKAVTKGKDQRPKNPGNIYLLPLVDVRYWWQFCGSHDYDANINSSWTDLSTAVCSRLHGADRSFTVDDEKYFYPDPEQAMLVRNTNAALHLDAIAASVGGQIVIFPEHRNQNTTFATVRLARWEDYPRPNPDDKEVSTALDPFETSPLIAGLHHTDELPASGMAYPETFRVVHRKWMYGRALRAVYEKDYDTVEEFEVESSQVITGLTHTIYTTAFCNVNKHEGLSVDDPPEDPDNIENIETLSLQLATDAFHRWVWLPAVHVVAGVYPLRYLNDQEEGKLQHLAQADRVEFHLGVRDPISGEHACFTKWVGLPQNFGPTMNLCQFIETPVFYSIGEFEVDEDHPLEDGPDEFGCNAVFTGTPSNGTDPGTPIDDEFRVFIGGGALTGSGITHAFWDDTDEKWKAIQKGCA